jgi:hypothetical protein
MNWSLEQVKAAEKRIAGNMTFKEMLKEVQAIPAPFTSTPRGANKWESLFRDELEMRRLAGELRWYEFEPIRLKLASFTRDGRPGRTIWYTPDFAALECVGEIRDPRYELVLYEVKGFWREAARVRIKLAASRYPFRFVAVRREAGEWKSEEFGQ